MAQHGIIDPEYGVREGWVRDEDNEISMDGYNAFIQTETNDGTTEFAVKNSDGTVVFSSKSSGDGYVAKKIGIGTYNPTTELDVIGTTKTNQFKLPTGAQDGYVLVSDNEGFGTWKLFSELPNAINPRGKTFNISVVKAGLGGNKWMNHESITSATDTVPIHFGYNVSLVGIVFINKDPNRDLDLEFYVNGISSGNLVYTEQIRKARRHIHTDAVSIFDLNIGDRLSVYIKRIDVNTNPNDTVVELTFLINSNDTYNLSAND